jgi:SHS2 domain-containing protein
MYETFDHTADLGLRIRAADLDALFVEAGRALLAVFVDDPASVRPLQTVTIQLAGDDREYLLFDWLNELLYRRETERLLLCAFEVRVGADGLEAVARGEPFDAVRHNLGHEVKAITYHGLCVEPVADGWQAQVIVDI